MASPASPAPAGGSTTAAAGSSGVVSAAPFVEVFSLSSLPLGGARCVAVGRPPRAAIRYHPPTVSKKHITTHNNTQQRTTTHNNKQQQTTTNNNKQQQTTTNNNKQQQTTTNNQNTLSMVVVVVVVV